MKKTFSIIGLLFILTFAFTLSLTVVTDARADICCNLICAPGCAGGTGRLAVHFNICVLPDTLSDPCYQPCICH